MIEQRIGYQLKCVTHALRMQMDGVLRQVGLTTPQYAVLSAIEENPGLSGNRLAQRCFITSQTTNLILVSLEKTGLIVRSPHPEYKRTLRAYLTSEGEKILKENHHKILALEEAMLMNLSEYERSQFSNILHTCIDSVDTHKRLRRDEF